MKKRLKTYPMSERKNLVKVSDFAELPPPDFPIKSLVNALPRIHAGNTFRKIIEALARAHKKKAHIVLGLGAHVVKCGLSPYLIALMENGGLNALAMNGAGSIHDFEIAAFGETSEDVAKELPLGRFGFVEETGAWMGDAIKESLKADLGLGRGLYEFMRKNPEKFPHRELSLIWNTGRRSMPCTIHVAVGTDIIHLHPNVDGASIGQASFKDFEIFCDEIAKLENGIYWNLGSAVILPEVFLKAVSKAHNLGKTLAGLTTIDMDKLMQYRAQTNVVMRPSAGVGQGFHLTGQHEIMVPLVVLALLEEITR